MYPRRRQFAGDFPELRATIRSEFEGGTSPPSAALKIAADIIAGLLRQLPEEARAIVLNDIIRSDPAALKALAAARLGRDKARASDAVAFAAQLIGVAVFMARRMVDEGTLRLEEFHHLLAAIDAALDVDAACSLANAFASNGDGRRP